jgi:rhamnulokinase
MTGTSFAAIDLGAESGRVMLGSLDGERLQLKEIHRFTNAGARMGGSLHWDVLRLWGEIKDGLRLAGQQADGNLRSAGLDTWGVDFGLLAKDDTLLGNPFHYRDSRTDGMLEEVFSKVPQWQVYQQTGIQFMQLNSLYQLYAMARANSPQLSIAERFLNMPDLFNFFLTAEKVNEFTISTTTQCYNPQTGTWAFDLLAELGIPGHIFGEIVPSGTRLGSLRTSLAQELNLRSLSVVASAGHDTASAVAAIPASTSDYIYLSSGTWSLLGVELDQPLISEDSMNAPMTNEGGVGDKIRFLKNIVGLWLLQECRRQWQTADKDYSYDDLTRLASDAEPLSAFVVSDDPRFLAPADMPATIQGYCQETGQPVPADHAAIVRCALESLAMEYRWVAEQIDNLTGKHHPQIHIIGGGSQNKLLNQFAANATGRTVVAGPVEATAIGNILVQAIALGEINSLLEGRELVRNSFAVETYEPQQREPWDEAYERYLILKQEN